MSDGFSWRLAAPDDLDRIVAIQDRVHSLESESRDVFAAKLEAFPQGSRVLAGPDRSLVGYGVFHPWRLHDAPPLHNLPFVCPEPATCLFVHDVALLPEARRHGAVRAFITTVRRLAQAMRIEHLALVSVYDTAAFWSRLGFAESSLAFDAAKRAQYGDTARYMMARVDERPGDRG